MACVLFPIFAPNTFMGFSKATLGQISVARFHRARVQRKDLSRSRCFGIPRPYVEFPERARAVQGGCRIIRSQNPMGDCRNTSIRSPWMWKGEWSSAGSKSQLQASWPRARMARRTMPLNSQPMRIRFFEGCDIFRSD